MIFIFFKYFRVLHSSWCSSALLIVFIPSDHALSSTSFFPQRQTTLKVVTLVPNLSSWVPLSAYEEFILKLCSRVLEWLTTDLMWKSKFFWFFTPTFTTILTSIKKGRCCLLDMIECQNSLNLACVEIAWKPNYFQLWIERYVRNFDFIVVRIHSCFSQDWNPLRHIDFTATLDLDRHRNDIS